MTPYEQHPQKIKKEDLDLLLKELASEFRKHSGMNNDVELIIVGVGSIMLNYSFRQMTSELDIISTADAFIKDCSLKIRDKYNLEFNWVNSDFRQTLSYSPCLITFSQFYKAFNNGHFRIRTVNAEYLIAMKLVASREYKNDRSDIIGIIIEENERGNLITADKIKTAFEELYGDTLDYPSDSRIDEWTNMTINELRDVYNQTLIEEIKIADKMKERVSIDDKAISRANIDAVVDIIKQEISKAKSH